ncbi:DUF2771 domain-containing protein [Mycolicibacterium mengxianglii]|uniref:DUF2771 domain-containing protein n=1 Tax=Mycolicibacterium mengxianglii TaxID=2736649 RepID=UPI0018EEE01A
MKRIIAAGAAAAVVLASAGTGTLAWALTRNDDSHLPEISAYTGGQLTRVGPFLYCNVLDLNDCETPQAQGELRANERDAVQLSVPSAIASAPWRLVLVYEDPDNATISTFRPDTRLAVTVPSVDPQRGRLTGVAVQLLTLVTDGTDEIREVPHAEWSIRVVWANGEQSG